MPIKIHRNDEAAYAKHLTTRESIDRSALSIGFDTSTVIDPELFVEGREFYPAILDDIAAASTSIHINQFGIRPGEVAERFTEILLAKAKAGVPVRMIVDARGSVPNGASRELFERLAAGGVEIFVNRPFAPRVSRSPFGVDREAEWNLNNLFAVDHRKVIIIDGRVGWIGTAGIEDRFEDGRHHDLFVRLGGPVVRQLQTVFLASYRWHGGGYSPDEIPALFPEPDTTSSGYPAIVLHNAPGRYRPISREIVDLLSRAEVRLDVMNPYVAHPHMFQLLIDAARRGVRVRLVVPPARDTWSTGYVRLYHHKGLIESGVEIWTYPAVAHAKAFVRDDADVLVGSCNLETWSLRRFFEIDVRIQSQDLASQFRTKLFDPDIAVSTPARPAHGFRERALSTAFYLISPLL